MTNRKFPGKRNGAKKMFFSGEKFAGLKKVRIFATAMTKTSLLTWCGSSVWLECRPVTPEVASSSLVRTAEKQQEVAALFAYIPLELAPRPVEMS